MKLITLNLWGGIVHEPLLKFLERQSSKTDIFCFQEMVFGNIPGTSEDLKVRTNLSTEISERLNGFKLYEYSAKAGSWFGGENGPLPNDAHMGQAIFVRKDLKVISEGGLRTYLEESTHAKDLAVTVTGNFQYIQFEHEGEAFVLGNLHGLWQEGSKKMDTPERLEQSRIVSEFFSGKMDKKILVGDFNMRPDIQSMEMFRKDFVDLIAKYNIQSTRTKFYEKPEAIQFSDYAFVSPDVEVIDFSVLPEEVSDHASLLLEFK